MTEASRSPNELKKHVGLGSATALVVANIIGAGIFTSTGFQAADLPNPLLIFGLWFFGGLLALCGALCYAELGASLPRAGAEYAYIRHTYGGLFSFLSAFVSLVVGFSAPIAAACKGFVSYASYFFPSLESRSKNGLGSADVVAIGLVWGLILVHSRAVHRGFRFNDIVTWLKVLGVLAIIAGASIFGKGDFTHFRESGPLPQGTSLFGAMATSLIFVMFCYSGFNASAYVASEMKHPQRDLPKSLILGTLFVTTLYLGLNAVYLYGASLSEMSGQVEVGLIASRALFGHLGEVLVTGVILVSILASASAMTIVGPRVSYALGQDNPKWSRLSRTSQHGVPTTAVILQGVVTTIILISGTIDQIQQYAGFVLALFSSLSVSCVIVLRRREPGLPRPFRAWGYPITPWLYLSVSGWTMIWAFKGRPLESIAAVATVALGGILYAVTRNRPSSSC